MLNVQNFGTRHDPLDDLNQNDTFNVVNQCLAPVVLVLYTVERKLYWILDSGFCNYQQADFCPCWINTALKYKDDFKTPLLRVTRNTPPPS